MWEYSVEAKSVDGDIEVNWFPIHLYLPNFELAKEKMRIEQYRDKQNGMENLWIYRITKRYVSEWEVVYEMDRIN